MMKDQPSIDPEILQDYVDDELDSATRLELGKLLANSPADQERVARYKELNDALHTIYDDVLTEPVPERLRRVLESAEAAPRQAGEDAPDEASGTSAPVPRPILKDLSWKHGLIGAAACLAMVAVGVTLGWKVRGDVQAQYMREMAANAFLSQVTNSYTLYAAEQPPWNSSSGISEASALLSWFKDTFGVEVMVPPLEKAGYQFAGGHALPSSTGPAGQLIYRNDEGGTVAVYFQATDASESLRLVPRLLDQSGRNFAQRNDISVYYWEAGELTYALIGSMAKDKLTTLVDTVFGGKSM